MNIGQGTRNDDLRSEKKSINTSSVIFPLENGEAITLNELNSLTISTEEGTKRLTIKD